MTQGFDEDTARPGTETVTGTETGTVTGTETETETETVPEAMVAEFSSLTTAYCWVITEDLMAGYDGTVPSAVGSYGPSDAGLGDLHEALRTGRWFRLAGQDGSACAVGRIYDPGGNNDRAPLDEIGQETWGATAISYRQGGQWDDA